MTIREKNAYLEGVKLCFIGDGNNMANSLIVGGLKAGLSVSVATPQGLSPHPEVLAFAEAYGDKFRLCHDPKQAIAGAEVVVTDAWPSMGRERGEEERRALFAGFSLTQELMALAAPGAIAAALPARPPGGGDFPRGLRGPRRGDLRGGGKPAPRPEGGPVPADGGRAQKAISATPSPLRGMEWRQNSLRLLSS